jgi:DNA-binding HxlR family transcriptional regulator
MDALAMTILKKLNMPDRAWGWYQLDRSLSGEGVVTGSDLGEALEQLEQQGLIESTLVDGFSTYRLSEAGRTRLDQESLASQP